MSQILNNSVAEIDAKLRKLTHTLQEGTAGTVVLVREWISIDATQADTLKSTIAVESVANPKADQQTYAGTWTVGTVIIEGDDTRAVTLVQTLVLPDADGVTSMWFPNCNESVTRKTYFNQTQAVYDAALALYDSSVETVKGRTVNFTEYRTNDLGLVDFTITITQVQVRNVPQPATGANTTGEFVTQTSFDVTREWKQIGVVDDANMRSVTQEDGLVKTRTVALQSDCSKEVTTREQLAVAQADVENVKRITAFDTLVEITAKNETAREIAETSQTQNQVVTTRSELTEVPGRYNNSIKTVSAKTAEVMVERTGTQLETRVIETAVNEAGRESEVSFSAGTIVTTSSKKNEFGSFDNSLDTRTATADGDADNERVVTQFENRATTTAKNEVAREVPVTTISAGTITRTSSQKNAFGRFDNSREDRIAVGVSNATKAVTVGAFSVETKTLDRNQSGALAPPTEAVAGRVKTVAVEKTDAKLFDNTTTEDVATVGVETTTDRRITVFDDILSIGTANQAAPMTPGVAVAGGVITRTKSEKNKYSLYDNVRTTETGIAALNSATETTVATGVTRTEVTNENQSSPLPDPAIVVGSLITHANKLNQNGLYETKVATTTPVPLTFSVTYDTLHGSASHVHKSDHPIGTAASDASFLTDGTSNDVSGQITPEGTETFTISKRPRSPENISANDSTYWKDWAQTAKVPWRGSMKLRTTSVKYYPDIVHAESHVNDDVGLPTGWSLLGVPYSMIHHLQGGRRKEAIRIWQED